MDPCVGTLCLYSSARSGQPSTIILALEFPTNRIVLTQGEVTKLCTSQWTRLTMKREVRPQAYSTWPPPVFSQHILRRTRSYEHRHRMKLDTREGITSPRRIDIPVYIAHETYTAYGEPSIVHEGRVENKKHPSWMERTKKINPHSSC